MLKKVPLPLMLVLLVCSVLGAGEFLPLLFKSFCLSLSLLLKSILLFVLPFIIIIYLASSLAAFEGNVFKFLGILLIAIFFSNFVSTMIAYGLAHKGLPSLSWESGTIHQTLFPLWSWNFSPLISNEMALTFGCLIGLGGSFFSNRRFHEVLERGKKAANFFLNRLFIPVIPFFVLGFLFKMEVEGVLLYLLKTYWPIVFLLATTYLIYGWFLYWIAAGFSFSRAIKFMKNSFPAAVTGFSTMSSAAALPLTLKGAEVNSNYSPLVKTIVPATVNIHLVGDSIGVPVLAMAIMITFGGALPDWSVFLTFVGYFLIAKLAIAAVPGGGMIVMIPVLEKYLGFTSEMTGLITALYLLFDPLFTSVNVMGNGAFAVILSKLMGKEHSKKEKVFVSS